MSILEKIFTCYHFLQNYAGLKTANMAYLGQLSCDIFRAINVSVQIEFVLGMLFGLLRIFRYAKLMNL